MVLVFVKKGNLAIESLQLSKSKKKLLLVKETAFIRHNVYLYLSNASIFSAKAFF